MDEGAGLDPTDRWFAANLKAARGERSQGAVAEYMREHGFPGFRQQTVARIEAGERGVQVGEALMLARAVHASLDDLTRPPELTRDAMVLRGATGRVRVLRDELADAVRGEAQARQRLETLVASLREAGKAEALTKEIRAAEQALAETVTFSDGMPNGPGAVAGPSENVERGEVTSDTNLM